MLELIFSCFSLLSLSFIKGSYKTQQNQVVLCPFRCLKHIFQDEGASVENFHWYFFGSAYLADDMTQIFQAHTTQRHWLSAYRLCLH